MEISFLRTAALKDDLPNYLANVCLCVRIPGEKTTQSSSTKITPNISNIP